MTMKGETVLNPLPDRLQAVLRCLRCESVIADSGGPLEGEDAQVWLEKVHYVESPGCR